MVARLQSRLKLRALLVLDVLEIGVLTVGSGVSIVFGKLLAALGFAVLAAGVASRIVRRRKQQSAPQPRPLWVTLVGGLLAIVSSAIAVEAANLPVRFGQSGFEKSNWLLVIALLLAFYWAWSIVLTRLLQKSSGNSSVTHR